MEEEKRGFYNPKSYRFSDVTHSKLTELSRIVGSHEKLQNKFIALYEKHCTDKKEIVQYGRQDITEIIEYLKVKNNNMIDGTVALNRRYATHLLNKVKKAYPEANTLLQVKAIIKTAKDDDFHSRNATSMKYLYYNTQKIIEIIKGDNDRVAII